MKPNTDFLSKKGKKPKKSSKPLVYDEKDREEYLTGFHKRNLEKKRKAKERYELALKKEKAEKRKQKREKLKPVLDDIINKMEEERSLLNQANEEAQTTTIENEEGCTTTIVTEPLEL